MSKTEDERAASRNPSFNVEVGLISERSAKIKYTKARIERLEREVNSLKTYLATLEKENNND